MSDYETHKGKITKVELDKPIIEFVKGIVGTLPDYYKESSDNDYLEYFRDELSDQYIIHNNDLYRISDTKYTDDADLFIVDKTQNGIEYTFKFYNGGTCLYEQIEEALNKLEEK